MKTERTGTLVSNGLRVAARTDPGRAREENEDRYFVDADAGIFLVVDGVGGHAAGEVAARIAHETIQKRLERLDAPADLRIREAITLANQQILLQADAPGRKGMACVLTLGVLEGRRLTVGHVGDTRLYRLSPDGIAKMTHDHSPVGEREDAREISETEAMQHTRRNEVYRDVGSERREPDAPDFIETLVTSLDDDAALLFCSDGLSDMLPSLEINRIVRANAGDAARVADALIDAANVAGGRDNITVIYIEGPRFARAQGAARVLPMARAAAPQVATEALFDAADAAAVPERPTPQSTPSQVSTASATSRRTAAPSRMAWLALGLLLGAAAAAGAGYYYWVRTMREPLSAARELVVGGPAAGAFTTIGEALAQARDGDTIRVGPGRYAEALEVRRDITLLSDQPHGAVLVVPPGQTAWASITVWSARSTLRGFRIANDASPGHVGIRIHTGDVVIADVAMEGPLAAGIDVVGPATRVGVSGSRFSDITGVPVQIGEGAAVTLRQNVFRAPAGSRGPAIACVSGVGLTLDSNVFMHFTRAPVATATGPAVIVDPSFVIPPPAGSGRRQTAPGARGRRPQ